MTDAIRLEHVGIFAQGELFERTVAFYEDVFGWTRYRELSEPWRIAFLVDGKGGMIEVLDTDGGPMPHPCHLSFSMPIADYPAKKSQLEQLGIVFDLLLDMPTGDKIAYFNDPAGNRAQIIGRVVPFGV